MRPETVGRARLSERALSKPHSTKSLMRRSTDTIGRQWELLRLVPREPRSITTAEIKGRLAEHGYDADVRTIQRDLTTLEAKFPLICRAEGRTNHWSWTRHHPGLDIPRLETPTAITLLLVRDYLLPLLPKSIGNELAPYFEKAKEVLKGTSLEQWGRRVRMIRRGPVLKAPTVAPGVLDAVYQALLEGRQLEADYRSREAAEAKRRRIHPLGLVTKEDVLYLVATLGDHQDVRQLALHRMSRAEALELPAKAPPGFTLKAYIEEERFAYPVDEEKIRLVAAFDEKTAAHLYEREISADQRLERREHDVVLRATVPNTSELRWWLLGFGDRVEVLEPPSLRAEFRAMAFELAKRYSPMPAQAARDTRKLIMSEGGGRSSSKTASGNSAS